MSDSILFDKALTLHQSGRFAEAEPIYRQVLQQKPNHSGALHLLGVIHQQRAEYEIAIELIARAISINPNKAVYHNNYGAALLSLGRLDEAQRSFQNALVLNPNFADALANLGMTQVRLKQEDAALASFQSALEIQPGHLDATKRLAMLLLERDQGEAAIRLYENSIANNPSAELRLQFRKLIVFTRHWESREPMSPSDRLLYDGTYYYSYDSVGNRTSRCQKDADGNRRNLTTYGWSECNRLAIVQRWDASGRCSESIEFSCGTSGSRERVCEESRRSDESYIGRNILYQPNSRIGTQRVAFLSPHCVLDFTNGAATATLDGLTLLASSEFECQAFCGTRFDAVDELLAEESLARLQAPYEVRNLRIGHQYARLIFTRYGKTAVTLFNTASTRGLCSSEQENEAFLRAAEAFLDENRPDVVWTYGGDPVSVAVQNLANARGLPIVFALHNLYYRDKTLFQMADCVIVPTEFARRHYRETLGLESVVLPLALDPKRVSIVNPGFSQNPCIPANANTTNFVTFVNPTPLKGMFIFARIAEVLSRRRPDILLLIVEGAAKAGALAKLGIELSGMQNVRVMPNTPDARQFLSQTKLLLMPSLVENAALVAREAMFNGIPVVASDRDGLPETIGNAAPTIHIPNRYTPDLRELPAAEEVAPWVETIIRLWDDAAEYGHLSRAARERAQQWHPDRLAPIYRDFFSRIASQSARSH